MAKIVFGMAVPHSGMLGQKPEDWLINGERDRKNPELWYKGKTYTYPELEALRGAAFEPYLTIEERTERAGRCRKALDQMAQHYRDARIDVAIVLGKDQKEIWPDQSPSITIYTGQDVHNGPPQRPVYAPDHHVVHQAYPEFADYLIKTFQKEGFDLNDLQAWPENTWMAQRQGYKPDYPVVPHAYSFVYHQIMDDQVPPHVPMLFNLFYPPTQPSMARCIQFGRVLREAIEAWPQDVRVAVIASGGLTHFVNDEDFDRDVMGKLAAYDYDGLSAIDDSWFQSGTSEVKIYSIVMMALQQTGAQMELVDYVPCWRTAAGTGEGMGFMVWKSPEA
jgi:hypothetical protein